MRERFLIIPRIVRYQLVTPISQTTFKKAMGYYTLKTMHLSAIQVS